MKRRTSILVIEPADIHFDILCRALSSVQLCKLVRCRTWTEGAKLSRSKRFDLILTEMKGLGSHQGADALVNFIQAVYPVSVIILTSEDNPDSWMSLMKAGAQDIWVKKEKLIEQLPSLIRQRLSQKKSAQTSTKDNPLQRLMDNLKGLKTSISKKGMDFATQKGLVSQLRKLELEMKQIKDRMFS